MTVSILLRSGSVVVIDRETREPLADRRVRILYEDGSWCGWSETDVAGAMSLALPEGSYRLEVDASRSAPDAGPASAPLEWTSAVLPQVAEAARR